MSTDKKLHRHLSNEEIIEFQRWARQNYKPFEAINGLWHPVIQRECVRINENADLEFEEEK